MKTKGFCALFAIGLFMSKVTATDLVDEQAAFVVQSIHEKQQDIQALEAEFKQLANKLFGVQKEYTEISNEYAAVCQSQVDDEKAINTVSTLRERTMSVYQEYNLVCKNIKDVSEEHMVVAGILNSLLVEYHELTGKLFELDQGKDNQNTKKASSAEHISKLLPANKPETKGAFSVISSGFRTPLPKAMKDEWALNLEKGEKLSRLASQNCLMPVNVVCNSGDEYFRATLVRPNHSPNKKPVSK